MGTAKNAINNCINDKTNMFDIDNNNVYNSKTKCNDDINKFVTISNDLFYDIDNDLINLVTMDNKDINNINNKTWRFYLKQLSNKYIKHNDIIYFNPDNYIYNPKQLNCNNQNKLINWYNINILCDIYLDLSDKYNKLVNVLTFITFIGINAGTFDTNSIYDINNGKLTDYGVLELSRLNALHLDIYKRIIDHRTDDIIINLYESPGAVGTIAIANNELGWNDSNSKQPQITNNYINYNQLPDFSEKQPQIGQNNP